MYAKSQYNNFQIFYGYPWKSKYFNKDVLRGLMKAVQDECTVTLKKQYQQTISIHISDLELREGSYLPVILRRQLNSASIGIFDISDHNPNVYYELGHMHGAGKAIIVLKEQSARSVADLEGIAEIRYDGNNLPAKKNDIVNAICKIIDQIRQKTPWDEFLWEHEPEAGIKVYLGWTASEFRQKRRKTPVGLSVGDVEVLNKLHKHFPSLNHQNIDLETDYTEFTGIDLSENLISIGGPRRNPCTIVLLELPEVATRINYEFAKSLTDQDGFVEYYIRDKNNPENEYHSNLRLQQQSRPEHCNGIDYGLIYKLTAVGDPVFRWIVLAGITRQGTLACLDCLNGNKAVQSDIITHSLNGDDTEILIKVRVIRSRRMNNPSVVNSRSLPRKQYV